VFNILSLSNNFIEMSLNQKQLFNAEETLEDFKVLLNRYKVVKNDETKLRSFLVRNRNPLWDLTNCKFYKTGLLSESDKNTDKKNLVDDHYIQRSRGIKFVFSEIEKNPNMGVETFINIVKKYSSTVKLTKEEHLKVTLFSKKNPTYLNYETYVACGIKVNGLSEIILK
jgi:hypothetical protein